MIDPATASAEVDLAAYRHNLTAIAELVAPAEVMAVIKADAYGHGMLACARAARAAGIGWLGVVTLAEAAAVRGDGDSGRLLAWMFGPDEDLAPAVADDVDLGVHDADQLNRVVAAAATCGKTARIHLKVDTGLSRNGCPIARWPALCAAAAEAEQAGAVEVVGVWSHFIASDHLELSATADQLVCFERAVEQARQADLEPIRHLANSAGALQVPESRFELVRVGIASYGVDPGEEIAAAHGVPLKPVMRLRAQLVNVKRVGAGTAVSYGATWTAPTDTVLGLVPLGYADGVPRHASNLAEVEVNGRRCPIRGRICMDQFVVDLGPGASDQVGDEVTLFGGSSSPSAEDWAEVCGTIGYEIVTRVGTRVPRNHRGGEQGG
ncbi:alanine racemase [Naumannella sp. ID2617S]|nr:alanine racemase [Naumannella sp. ID2617S]